MACRGSSVFKCLTPSLQKELLERELIFQDHTVGTYDSWMS